MALMECIIFASVCAVIQGTPNPPLENPTAYCSAWGSVSWTLCAVAIAAFLASIVTIIRLTKEKRKNSQSREGKESRRLIAENSSSNCLACSDVCCGLLFAAILALVPFIVMFFSLFEENTPANCPTWKPYSWFSFAASIALLLVFIVTLICLIKERHNSSQDSWPAESKSVIASELKALNDELMAMNETLEIKIEILAAQSHKADVILDPRTAHPKLKVSGDGKSVWNTGNVSKVSDWEKRFDSRTFILGKSGFSEGKHYWEVETGQNKTWDLGVASATVCRKGEITLSPENGYWVIGCDDGKDYWARTEQWTRLKVNGKLTRLGIFLDKSDGSLSFYDVCSQRKLHTYKTLGDGELYPFFYIGSVTEQPLKIVIFERK